MRTDPSLGLRVALGGPPLVGVLVLAGFAVVRDGGSVEAFILASGSVLLLGAPYIAYMVGFRSRLGSLVTGSLMLLVAGAAAITMRAMEDGLELVGVFLALWATFFVGAGYEIVWQRRARDGMP